jgi:hypothetical protein
LHFPFILIVCHEGCSERMRRNSEREEGKENGRRKRENKINK